MLRQAQHDGKGFLIATLSPFTLSLAKGEARVFKNS